MRTHHRPAAIGLALGLLALPTLGCGANVDRGGGGADPRGVDAPAAAPHASFTGQEIFRGTMFGTGPVAALLPEIWKHPQVTQAVERARGLDYRPTELTQLDKQLDDAAASEPDISPATMTKFRTLMDRAAHEPADRRVRATAHVQARMQRLMVAAIEKEDPSFFTRFGVQMQSGNQVRIDAAIHDATRHLVEVITRLTPAIQHEDGCGACGACGGQTACGQASCGQGSCGQGQGSCGQGQASCGQGQSSCGQGQASCGQGQQSCGGQSQGSCGSVGGSGNSNWFYNTNYVYTVNWGAISNAVAGVTAVAAGVAAVIVLAFFWDPGDGDGRKDVTGLAPDRTLQRQMVVDTIAKRLQVI
ncbi:MAG TPA: hypothetical protein VIF09_13495 [Polyangiaceae bacterium]